MILFIASEVMFFAALFGAYFTIRAGADVWPPEGAELEVLLPAIATAVLVASSVTVHVATARTEENDRKGTSRWLLVTMGLGLVFLAAQVWEYQQLDFSLADHTYGTLFYSMTGFHALHVSAGVIALGLVWLKNARGQVSETRPGPIIAAGLYWHFVDIVWLLLFATLYLLR
jgi:cytochrome c oxidase subunit 3